MNISRLFGTLALLLTLAACTKDDPAFDLPINVLPDSSWPQPPLATPMDVAGVWYSRTTNNAVNCGIGEYVDAKTIVINQDRFDVSMLNSAGDRFVGKMNGDILEWSGSFPERNGMTDFTSTMLIFSAESGAGDASWNWSNGADSCNGTMAISFAKNVIAESSSNSWPDIADSFLFVDNVAYFTGSIGAGGDTYDYFSFTAENDAILQVELSHFDTQSSNLDLMILDETLQEIGRSDSIDNYERVDVPVIAGSKYYVEVAATALTSEVSYHIAMDLN